MCCKNNRKLGSVKSTFLVFSFCLFGFVFGFFLVRPTNLPLPLIQVLLQPQALLCFTLLPPNCLRLWMKERCVAQWQVCVCVTLASLPSPGLAAAAASAPRRVGRRDKKKNNRAKKTRGNNGRVVIACNSIYTITHSIRGLDRKTADYPLMSGWAQFQILA